MDKKVKSLAIVCMVLLLGLAFVSFVSFDVDVAYAPSSTVTWDYYVRAGANTSSPQDVTWNTPDTASDTDFDFAAAGGAVGPSTFWDGPGWKPAGFDFGNISRLLYMDPQIPAILERAWTKVEITNNKGYDIVITDLTAEVTNGTETLVFLHGFANMTFRNSALVYFDQLDPWDPGLPTLIDECDYFAGVATPQFEGTGETYYGDTYTRNATGPTNATTGAASLVQPDAYSDAAATGHVAPIILAADDTFTEYFGVQIFGKADSGTPIWGTITLTLTYVTYTAPTPPYDAGINITNVAPYVKDASGTPRPLVLVDGKYLAYADWTLQIKVTVKNNGTIPINFTVSAYQNPWIGTTLGYNLTSDNSATAAFDWDLSGVTVCAEYSVKANATLNANGTQYVMFGLVEVVMDPNVKVTVRGDADGGGSVNILDVGAVAWTMAIGGYNVLHDLDLGGAINILDVGAVAWEMALGTACP